jgi:SOS response regulatory protein OraA/RecX
MSDDPRATALSLLARRAYTSAALARALAERGVGEAEAAAVVAECETKKYLVDEGEALERALEQKARRLAAGLTPEARSKKLFAHLVRRGFAPAAVIEALHRKGEATDDDFPAVDV